MTTLSESNERWPPKPIKDDPFSTEREKWDMWRWLVQGAAEALDRDLASHTNGPVMGVVDMENDTAPAVVERAAVTYPEGLLEAFRTRIHRIDDWEPDTRDWGPGPFDYPDYFDERPADPQAGDDP